MRILVFGANGPTGRLVVRDALRAGHNVTAFTRRANDFRAALSAQAASPLAVVEGDVHDRAAVERAMVGHDAVISTLGVPFGKAPITVYSDGIESIIGGMHSAGVKRLLCVSSSVVGAGSEEGARAAAAARGGGFFENLMQRYLVGVLGKTLYADMAKMEQIVRASDLDYTIVRPSGLFETPEATDYVAAENAVTTRFTSRADLAAFLVAQVDDVRFVRTTAAIGTVQVKPSMLQLIWREGIRKPRPALA